MEFLIEETPSIENKEKAIPFYKKDKKNDKTKTENSNKINLFKAEPGDDWLSSSEESSQT